MTCRNLYEWRQLRSVDFYFALGKGAKCCDKRVCTCVCRSARMLNLTPRTSKLHEILVHGQVTIIFVVFVGLSVCLFVCAEFFSAVFDPISIKLGHMLYVCV